MEVSLNLQLHPVQGKALETPATEVLFGGSAGGGKSHLMRVAAVIWCSTIPGLQFYLFRRLFDDLIKNHVEGPQGFRNLLGPWVEAGLARITDNTEITLWNKSKIFLCHLQHKKDLSKYRGPEMHVLGIEEATEFEEDEIRFLRSRNRMIGVDLPEQYKGRFPRILMTSNPGGKGHHYLKEGFVDHGPWTIRQMPENEGGMLRQFIPAKLEDNPSMQIYDPGYEAKLSGLGSPQMVAALRDGDWSVVSGAYFPELRNPGPHVIAPFTIPDNWLRFRSFDWGYAKPFSVGWYAVSDGACYRCGGKGCHDTTCKAFPRGALIKYREWYGKQGPNKGIKLTDEQVAAGIVGKSLGENYAYSVADPSIFDAENGPCRAEVFRREGVLFKRADNSRVPGWSEIRSRLVGVDGRPMLYFFHTCLDSLRTIPALQHDEKDQEDLNDDGEDHAADETRYACMSRPYAKRAQEERAALPPGAYTLNDLYKDNEQGRKVNRI